MATLYKEFSLTSIEVWKAFKAIVRDNAKAFKDAGRPLRIILTSSEKRRTLEQNAYYFGFIIEQIADQVWIEGRQYDKAVWHEYLAGMFADPVEIPLPDGTILTRRKSTSEMTVAEFTEYIQKVEAYAASELFVRFVDTRFVR